MLLISSILDYPGTPNVISWIPKVKEREEFRVMQHKKDSTPVEEGAPNQGMQWPPEDGKDKEIGSLL